MNTQFIVEGETYLIPNSEVMLANSLVEQMPGWMGMYIEEFKMTFEEYKQFSK